MSANTRSLALVLSFFARSDRPLSFVSAQVTGETTYTRRTARSRAPFAEDSPIP